jgi:cytochrome c biogenesis protein CcmG/thiol:disulfide interchange protein DsbE
MPPYAKVGLDRPRRYRLGFYGVPETFIVRGDGLIAYKVIGPINAETLDSIVKPEFAKAMK